MQNKNLENEHIVIKAQEEQFDKIKEAYEANEEFEELKTRNFASNIQYWFVTAICFIWSVFQLYIAYYPINTTIARSVHLTFAVCLVYLLFPLKFDKKAHNKIPVYDWILCFLALITILFPAYDFYGLATRPGDYTLTDVITAWIGIILLFEASRRTLGPALGTVAGLFLIYDYFGRYMPDIIAHAGASLNKIAGHMFLTSEGVFGVPIGVSVTFIYLFVLFGALLEKAGAGQYFINLAFAMLGQFRGGPAKASVIASGLSGMVSGSSTANVVTVGTFTIPLMKQSGLSATKAGAIEVAAGVNGQLIPPIMGAAAFIIAEFLGMSYSYVMLAAVIPAFAIYASLFFIVHLESCKLGLKGMKKEELGNRLEIFLSGIHYFIPIAMLLFTLLVLKHSAISAAFNSIIVLFFLMILQQPISKLIFKQKIVKEDFLVGFKDIFVAMVNAAKNMVTIACATGLAGIIVGSISLTGIGQVMTEVVEFVAGNNIFLILVLSAFMALILGLGLPTTANYIVVASLVAPVVLSLSAKNGFLIPAVAIHFFIFYFGILADETPPVGIAAYAAAGIAKANPISVGIQGFFYDIRTAILPFAFFFNNKLLLIESATDIYDAKSITWITNPIEILFIAASALVGMFAFTSALQGYLVRKTSIIERVLLLVVTGLVLVPNLCAQHIPLIPNEFIAYVIGFGLYGAIFAYQWQLGKKDLQVAVA